MPITSRFVFRSTVALLAVGFLALLAIVGMTIWLGEQAQVHFTQFAEARDARSAAVELRNAVLGAESSQRGFLVTGNEVYLSPYNSARTEAQRQLAAVKRLLAPYPEAAGPVARLETVIAEKFAEMDETIALKRERRESEVLSVVRTNRGKALMDEANIFFSGLIEAADRRVNEGAAQQSTNATWLRWVSLLGGIIIVAVVGGAMIAIGRYTRELAAARDEVAALNSGLEDRVRERTADLAQANEEIQRFAYIVTHDLRAPLVNIMGFTAELEEAVGRMQALIVQAGVADATDPVAVDARAAVSQDLPEAIGFIRSSTKKMDTLINTILKLSREGRRPLRPERFELGDVVKASAAAIQHQVTEAEGTVESTLKVPPLVQDRQSLEMIFGNLLDNAVKYRANHRPLRIAVSAAVAPGDRIAIEVADNGRGIDEQDFERVFELFRRSGEQDRPGEGIGLAYVRTAVRNLGGEVTLRSSVGQGTTFRIILPRVLDLSERALQ